MQQKMPQLEEQLEKRLEKQFPKLQEKLPELGKNLSAALGLPDLDLKQLKDLQEVQHLSDMDIGKELIGPFEKMPTWQICQELPNVLKYFWSVTDTNRQNYVTK